MRTQLASCGSEQNRQIVWGSQKPPVPHLPMNLNSAKISLVDLHAEELARQLTLIEYDLYRKIKPKECLNQKWVKGDKDVNAPNILAMIKRFNQVCEYSTCGLRSCGNLILRSAHGLPRRL